APRAMQDFGGRAVGAERIAVTGVPLEGEKSGAVVGNRGGWMRQGDGAGVAGILGEAGEDLGGGGRGVVERGGGSARAEDDAGGSGGGPGDGAAAGGGDDGGAIGVEGDGEFGGGGGVLRGRVEGAAEETGAGNAEDRTEAAGVAVEDEAEDGSADDAVL